MHSSKLLERRIKEIENDVIVNSSKNPTITPRTAMANLSTQVQSEGIHAVAKMRRLSATKQQIYRAR